MDCNKDEAIRGKDIAEKKMQNNDFEGARRIAMKAQQLFPELENINQLLTVCNVHCAAQNKIDGSEKDFYGILQLAKFADEVTIKKQYRKLVLTLHPDKNKLPGTEAAFKLVGEANIFLLDPGKKAVYDSKCKVLVRTAQAKPPSYQFCSLNRRQTTSIPSVIQETFYTVCLHCKTKLQYPKRFVNHVVHCQRCTKTFAAYALNFQSIPDTSNQPRSQGMSATKPHSQGVSSTQPLSQGVPSTASGAGRYQTPVFPSKDTPHAGSSRMDVPNAASIHTKLHGYAAEGLKMKCDNKDGSNQNSVADDKHGGVHAHKNKRESGVDKNGRKRLRMHVAESSESSDTLSSNDLDEATTDEACATDYGVDGARITRRSSRHRQNVSYNENGSDNDDFESPFERSSKSESSGDNVVKEATVSKNDAEPSTKKSFSDGTPQMEKIQKATNTIGHAPVVVEIPDDFEPEQTVYHLPDTEFTDFDKEKDDDCFAVGQIWALYDTLDGMPRFYALIKKVFKPGFKVQINWLEGDPEDDGEISWLDEELPFGCGRFQWGDSEINSDRLSFSHQVHYRKSKKSVFIRPQKGEIWALIQDWNINWNSDPENHKKYKYEIVEVVSDFSEDTGIRVSYLDKVRGFACLFQRASISEIDFLVIRSDQMLRFSHRIPSAKMTGTESEGVPVGSFELDPASLPSDPNDISYRLKVMSDNENLQIGIDRSGKKSENVVLPAKYADSERKTADFVRRSPRGKKMNDIK